MGVQIKPLKMKNFKRKQRGLSLAEAGLVLGLGMFAFAIAYGFYKSGSNSITTQSQITGMVNLASNVERAYRAAKSYEGITTENIAQSGIVPDAFRVSGSVIKHGWNGDISIAPAGTANEGYTITFGNMPPESCVEFVSGVEAIASIIQVGSTTVKDLTAADVDDKVLDVASLMTSCNVLTGDIVFTNQISTTTTP